MGLKTVWGGKRLLFFYERISRADLRVVERQMSERKFDPSLILGTAERCMFGYPRVVVCSPFAGLTPFPTSFWLTCPWLYRFAGTIESRGGVGELERLLSRYPHEWLLYNVDHSLARLSLLPPAKLSFLRRFKSGLFDRLRRGGVGGTRHDAGSPARVKCIHLQIASWLAFRRHPGEEWLEERGAGQDCGGVMKKFCSCAARRADHIQASITMDAMELR